MQIGAVLVAAIFFQLDQIRVIWWIIATTCISIVSFIVNESTDRHDVDKHSWNKVHMQSWKGVRMDVVWLLGLGFSIAGLSIAHFLGVLGRALVMWVFAVTYSGKPLRFKGIPVMDIVSQLVVWWIVPFMALVWGHVETGWALYLATMAGGFLWYAFYPYQIADYVADKQAGIKPTHVVVGVKSALKIGVFSGAIAVVLYAGVPSLWSEKWIWPFVVTLVASAFKYYGWLKSTSTAETLKSLQRYIVFFKPITQLLVVYLGVFYFFFS